MSGSTESVLGTSVDRDGVRLIRLRDQGWKQERLWDKLTLDIVGAAWRDDEDGPIYEIDGPESAICMWHLSALGDTGSKPKLVFDSIQYSLFARVVEAGGGADVPLHACRTVFISIKPCEVMRLEWQDRSWRPIVAGFLIGGTSS